MNLVKQIGIAPTLEQTAEECNELIIACSALAHACLKEARIVRGENPHEACENTVIENLCEEIADVRIMIQEICDSNHHLSENVDKWDRYKRNRMLRRFAANCTVEEANTDG